MNGREEDDQSGDGGRPGRSPSNVPGDATGVQADAIANRPTTPRAQPWSNARRAALLVLLPLVLLAHAFQPDRRFLPHLPVTLAPLRTEAPEGAALAQPDTNYFTADRVFPTLTDQAAAKAMLAGGELPLWEPSQGLGVPLLAGTIAGFAYPLNWLALAGDPARVAAYLAFLTLVLAGLGMWLWLARLGLRDAACALGAMALQGGGWGLLNLQYPMKVDAAIWLPFALWASEGVLRRRPRAGLALAAFTALPLLAGFPPVALFGSALVVAYAGWRTLLPTGWANAPLAGPAEQAPEAGPAHAAQHAPHPTAPIAGRFVAVLVLLTCGVLMSAVQILPTLELSRLSVRQDATPTTMEAQALPAVVLRGLGLAHLFGAPDEPIPVGGEPMAWSLADPADWERTQNANALEWNAYAGLAIVLLALVGMLCAGRRALFPALLLALVVGFATGAPVVRGLYHVPGLDLGSPGRILALAWFLWAWLAALGAQVLLDSRLAPRRARAAAALLVTVAVVACGYAWLGRGGIDVDSFAPELEAKLAHAYERGVETVREVVAPEHARLAAGRLLRSWTLALGVAALLTAAALLLLAARRSAAWLLLALALGVEAYVAGAPHLVAPALAPNASVFPPSPAMAALVEAAGDGRLLRLDPHADLRDVEALARPNLPHAYGAGDLTPYQVFTPTSLVELFAALDPDTRFRSGIARLPRAELLGHPILDRARVTAILARQELQHPRLESVYSAPGFHVYRRTGSLPLAGMYAGLEARDAETGLGLLASGAIDAQRQALIVGAETATSSLTQAGSVDWSRPAPDRLDVSVAGTSGGWLVMREQWYPGWRCSVDGRDAELFRADHAFRAVRLGPGDHDVRTWYAPRSVSLGLWLGLLGLVIALALDRRAARDAESRPLRGEPRSAR